MQDIETPGRARKPRNDRGPRLTARDLTVMRWVGEQYAIRFDQLQTLLGRQAKAQTKAPGVLSDSATRHTVDRWEVAGLAEYKKFLADEPGVVWLTTKGYHVADLPFKKYEPSPASLAHIYWCNQTRLALSKRPDFSWQSERWLRSNLDQKIKSVKLPDALLHMSSGGVVAVEVELTQKNAATLTDILRDRTLVYAQVWYFASESVARAIVAARAQLEPDYQRRIQVYELKALL